MTSAYDYEYKTLFIPIVYKGNLNLVDGSQNTFTNDTLAQALNDGWEIMQSTVVAIPDCAGIQYVLRRGKYLGEK